MKRLLVLIGLAVLLWSGGADAVTFTNVFDPADVFFATNANAVDTLTFTHDLTDGGITTPFAFNPAAFTLTSASISILFYDDSDPAVIEQVDITLDGVLTGSPFTILSASTAGAPSAFNSPVLLAALQSDGKLVVTLDRHDINPGVNGIQGDFFFAKSTLTAEGEPIPQTNGVPLPSTLMLLGAGLIVTWYAGRRQAR